MMSASFQEATKIQLGVVKRGRQNVEWHINENSKKITLEKLFLYLPIGYHFVKKYYRKPNLI
jgi:hypothetical protein